MTSNPVNSPLHDLQRAQQMLAAQRWGEARPLLEALLAARPGDGAVFHALCEAEIMDGAAAAALARLDTSDMHRDPEAAFLHARALAALGREGEARGALRALRARLPAGSANLELHLAAIEERLGDAEGACDALERAAALLPGDAALHVRLARAQASLARPDGALGSLHAAVEAVPRDAATWHAIGQLYAEHFEWQKAVEALAHAARLDPGEPRMETLASVALQELGDLDSAARALERAAARDPGDLNIAVARRLMLPQVYADTDDLGRWRARYAQGLAELRVDESRWRPRAREVFDLNRSNFLLAYQGEDDRALQREYSRFVAGLAGAAWPEAREAMPPRFDGSRPLRVGFASSFFRDCTVGRYFERWITSLDARRFERFVYHTGALSDEFTRRLGARAEHFALLRSGSIDAATRIRADALDVLVYPEVGMDAMGYILATLRLAPVQVAAWGHPVTTGSDAIDYYLTVDSMEPDGAEGHYEERLLRLPGPGVDYALPGAPPRLARADFRLPEGPRLYACPQSLFKIHPAMDALLADIAAADPEGLLVFFQGQGPAVNARFAERLQRALAARGVPPRGQVKFMPRMGRAQFAALLGLADVVLDTLHWSGGNTSFDAFAAGTPVVTLPGRFMRGRQTAAMLRAIGVDELVAASPEDYVALALRVGRDRTMNAGLRERIAAGRGAIFERPEPVRALAEALLWAAVNPR